MGRSKKFDYQAAIESRLAEQPDGLTLDELLERSELDVDRSTLFRHLSRLIEQGRAERIGKARASRYRLINDAGSAADAASFPAPNPEVRSAPELSVPHLPDEIPPPAEPPRLPVPGAMPADAPTGAQDTPPSAADYAQFRVEPVGVPDEHPNTFAAAGNPPRLRVEAHSASVEDLKYGPLVKKAVRRIVRERNNFNPVNLEIYLSLLVPHEELDEFAAVVCSELADLREDNLYRFELSPAEFSGFVPLGRPESLFA